MTTLHLSTDIPGPNAKTFCGKKCFVAVREGMVKNPEKRNILTIINQAQKQGKQITLCIYCTKWADMAALNSIDLLGDW